jgi:hypothetical protein
MFSPYPSRRGQGNRPCAPYWSLSYTRFRFAGPKPGVARPRFRLPREPCRCPEPRSAVRTVREPPLQGSALATALYPYPYADAP